MATEGNGQGIVARSIWKLAAIILLLAGLEAYGLTRQGAPTGPTVAVKLNLPAQLGSWRGSGSLDAPTARLLWPDPADEKTYTLRGSGDCKIAHPTVGVLVTYSRDPSTVHVPIRCLTNFGWTIIRQQKTTLRAGAQSIEMNVVEGETKGRRSLQAYFFYDTVRETAGGMPGTLAGWIARIKRETVPVAKAQFSFDPELLNKDGSFSPQIQGLVFGVADYLRGIIAPHPVRHGAASAGRAVKGS